MKQNRLILFFLLSFSNAYANGIFNEEILDSESIQKLQAELKELDGITTTSKTTPQPLAQSESVIEDEQTTSSSAIKKMDERLPAGQAEQKEENVKDSSEFVDLERFF